MREALADASVVKDHVLDTIEEMIARLDAIVSPAATAATRLRVLAARADTTLDALHGDLDAIAGWDNPEWLAIPVPTLVVTADADTPAIQAYAREWAAGLAHGTLASIPSAGHMMPIEQPEATVRAIIADLNDRVRTLLVELVPDLELAPSVIPR